MAAGNATAGTTGKHWGLTAAGRAVLVGAVAYGAVAAALSFQRGTAGEAQAGQAAAQAVEATDPAAERARLVERGRYLVTIGGCNDCHTPWTMTDRGPRPDMTRMLSGHPEAMKVKAGPKLAEKDGPWVWHGTGSNTAFAGPWGITYAFNLTPDEHTGIGIWTEEIFVKAMRTGKHWGESRPIMPPMPWQNLAAMTDADLKAMWTYLRSIPPVKNLVPDYQPPEQGR